MIKKCKWEDQEMCGVGNDFFTALQTSDLNHYTLSKGTKIVIMN